MSASRSPSKNKQLPERQDRNHFLQEIADHIPDLMAVIEINTREVLYVNNRVVQLLGVEATYIYEKGGEILETLLHPEDLERCLSAIEASRDLKDHEEADVEVRLKSADGTWNWFKIRAKVFRREADGTVSQTISIAQNIQGQKMADIKLKEEHRRLENAQAIGHIGSFERTLPGEHLICSDEFYKILGIEKSPEGISLQHFISFVHPEDREAFSSAIDHTLITGEALNEVNRIVRSDGSIRNVRCRTGVIFDGEGNPLRMDGTLQDITRQIEAQYKLKQSEALMRRAEEVGHFGSYEFDLRNGELRLSDGFYRLFGYEPRGFEPTVEFIDSVSHPEDTQRVQKVLEQAKNDKQPYLYYRRIYLPTGQIRYLSCNGKVICDEAGNAIQFLGIVEDITDRKKSEEKLEESSLFVRKVASTTPDILFVFDLEHQQLKYINRDLFPLLGKHLEALQFMDPVELLSLVHHEDRENAIHFIRIISDAKEEEMEEVEFRIRNVVGDWRWYHCRGRVFKRSGEGAVLQQLFILRDVTEEKNTIKALLEAEKLSIKGDMARTIAHEVRGPAANISISMEIIQKELGDKLEENAEAKVFFDIVTKSCTRITDFINDLISISSSKPATFAKNDLGVVVENVLKEAQDRIFLRGIKVMRHFRRGYFVKADHEKLKIAILNIVMNAIEAMEDHKGLLQVVISEQKNKFKVTIQDNGCGMTEEQLSKMFNVYYTNKPNGMGVGLANVHTILKDHSAQIEVKSKPGKGTSFSVFFTKTEEL